MAISQKVMLKITRGYIKNWEHDHIPISISQYHFPTLISNIIISSRQGGDRDRDPGRPETETLWDDPLEMGHPQFGYSIPSYENYIQLQKFYVY